tara:strand:- start:2575 stop:2829 length:255 start_codon:yes stop_codon:yes gene_type:complete
MDKKKIEIIKKKIIYRCLHTGTKETDLLFKKIIVNKINLLKENELIQLSKIFQVLSDIEIFQILTKKNKSNSLYKEIFNKLLNE